MVVEPNQDKDCNVIYKNTEAFSLSLHQITGRFIRFVKKMEDLLKSWKMNNYNDLYRITK